MLSFIRAAVTALILAVPSANALPYTGFTLFGDSLSDSGNAFFALGAVTTPPFQQLIPDAPYERGGGLFAALSNGPIWAEAVGSALGLSLGPSGAGGTNYAFGGADSGPLPDVPPGQSPTVVQQFFAPALPSPPAAQLIPLFGAGPIMPTDLYAVWGGGNDIRSALGVYQAVLMQTGDALAAQDAASNVVAAGVNNIASILGALAQGGAQHILSLNVPDVGLAPAVSSSPIASALATGLSIQFNLGLAAAIDNIESTLSLDVIEVDTFGLVRSVVANPAAFGLTNAVGTCIELGGGACADPDTYFFWDGIHPTTAGHRIIAGAVLETLLIPLPGTLALLVVGALGLIVRARLRR